MLSTFRKLLLSIFLSLLVPVGPGWLSLYSDSLRAGRSGYRIPVWARFLAPVQTGPGAHQASYTVGTESLAGVKWPERGVDYPPHLAPKLKEE